jgi:hypothetical protein
VQFLVGAGRTTDASSPVPATARGDAQDAVVDTVGPPGGSP